MQLTLQAELPDTWRKHGRFWWRRFVGLHLLQELLSPRVCLASWRVFTDQRHADNDDHIGSRSFTPPEDPAAARGRRGIRFQRSARGGRRPDDCCRPGRCRCLASGRLKPAFADDAGHSKSRGVSELREALPDGTTGNPSERERAGHDEYGILRRETPHAGRGDGARHGGELVCKDEPEQANCARGAYCCKQQVHGGAKVWLLSLAGRNDNVDDHYGRAYC